jgi:hypothetical protein
MTTRTFEVEHEGTHYPTDKQMHAALVAALKAEDLKIDGSVEFLVVENTSGGPSKVKATIERTMTAGGRKTAPKPKKDDDVDATMTAGGSSD